MDRWGAAWGIAVEGGVAMPVAPTLLDELTGLGLLALLIALGALLAAIEGLALWFVAPVDPDEESGIGRAFKTAYGEMFVTAGLGVLVEKLGTGSPIEHLFVGVIVLAIPVVAIQLAYRTTLWRAAWTAVGMRLLSGAILFGLAMAVAAAR